ncbi:MAG: hypothetical protein WC445_00820 [Patescibacteria group bacterium]
MREKIGAAPEGKTSNLKTPEGFSEAVIRKPSSEEISRISVEDTAELMRKFLGLAWFLPHLETYGETPEAERELKSVVDNTLKTMRELDLVRDRLAANKLDKKLVEKSREAFINHLFDYLQFVKARIERFLLPSAKYKKQVAAGASAVPVSFRELLEAYLRMVH